MKRFKYMMMAAALVCGLATLLACGQKSQREGDKTAAETSAQAEDKTTAEVTPDSVGYLVKVGDMAPDFTVELTDGSKVILSTLRGKLVMLQFTASWCGVCRKEMPFIESDIWQPNKERKDFVLIGIDRDEPLEKVKEFAQQTKVTYPLGLDPGADIFALYADRQAGITRNVLIDPDGRIIKLTRLYNPEEFASLVALINERLGK
ncbi:MAG: TlpA disulfide reductase family protein [Mediterranea sp.]|nr:TlpA disulfide reductase family protein [Mediterranea sp.]